MRCIHSHLFTILSILVLFFPRLTVSATSCPDFSMGGTFNLEADCTLEGTEFISTNTTINGNGFTITAGNSNRLFFLNTGIFFTINDATITGVNFSGGGGVVYNSTGTLTLSDSIISNNSAHYGAFVMNDGTLIISNTTFSNNSGSGGGGVIFNNSTGTLTISNSTFSENSSSGNGGAIFNVGTLTVSNSTFSGNSAGLGEAIFNVQTLTLHNTILANSVHAKDCFTTSTITFSTGTSNIIENDSTSNPCGIAGTNYLALDPGLDSLTNGYFPLNDASPAIDAGDDTTCEDTAQNGIDRPQGEACDIGSYEVEEASEDATPVSDIVTTPLPVPTQILIAGEIGSTAPLTSLIVPNTSLPLILVTDLNGNSFNPNVDGNITGQVIANPIQEITPEQGARIGNLEVIKRGVITALDITLFSSNGQPLTTLARPLQMCIYGTGDIIFLAANTHGTRIPIELNSSPSGSGYTCFTLSEPGTIVLVQS